MLVLCFCSNNNIKIMIYLNIISMNVFRYLIFTNLALFVISYVPFVPVNIFLRTFDKKYNLDDIQVFEPFYMDKKNTSCLVFFTGGSSVISHDIYSNVITDIANKNISVYIPKYKYNKMDELFELLKKEYKEVITIGHSSGASTLINTVSNKKNINKIILVDPVDTRLVFKNKLKMKNVKNVLFLHADKSYNGNPISFIPSFFRLLPESFIFNKDCNVQVVESKDHGHCDILNPVYSNFMYNSKVCDGLSERDSVLLRNYHNWISKVIYLFIQGKRFGISRKKSEFYNDYDDEDEDKDDDDIESCDCGPDCVCDDCLSK